MDINHSWQIQDEKKKEATQDPATTGGDVPKKPGMVGKLSILQCVLIVVFIFLLIVIISIGLSAWKSKKVQKNNELRKQAILTRSFHNPSVLKSSRSFAPTEMQNITSSRLVPDMITSPRDLPNVPALTPRKVDFLPTSQPDMFDITDILSPRVATMPEDGYNFISNAFPRR